MSDSSKPIPVPNHWMSRPRVTARSSEARRERKRGQVEARRAARARAAENGLGRRGTGRA